MKNIYKKRLQLRKEVVVEKILKSKEFKVEREYGYGGVLYGASQISSIFIRQSDTYSFQFSENAGMGGLTETIGQLDIKDVNPGTVVTWKDR